MKPSALATCLFLAPALAAAQSPWTFTHSTEVRGRYEDRNNRDFASPADDNREDALLRVRLNLTLQNKAAGLTAFFQPQVSADSISLPNRDTSGDHTAAHQLYVEWRPPAQNAWTARAGRQELAFGNERLVGAFNWSNVGRSFDGLRVNYARGPLTVSTFGTQLGHSPLPVTSPKLYGVYAVRKPNPASTMDLYVLHKRDRVAAQGQSITTVGTRSERRLNPRADYIAEAALQTGRTGGRDLAAWAFSVNAGTTLDAPIKPRLAVEVNGASGGDPADTDEVHTFDQLFPTNHDKYGIADYQGWRNMYNLRLSATAKPLTALSAGADYHWFWLQNPRDFWYGATGRPNVGAGGVALRDPSGAAGRNVGQEFDLYGTYTVNPNWSVHAGFARFMPGSFVRRVNGRADASNWWTLQALWRR